MNSLQAILITDGITSHAVFTYKCGSLSWSRSTVIGYNAAGSIFENHPQSGRNARNIACSNAPISNWTNVIYNLTGFNINITEPSTVEPREFDLVLHFLESLLSSEKSERNNYCIFPFILSTVSLLWEKNLNSIEVVNVFIYC